MTTWNGLANQLLQYDAVIFDKDGTLFDVEKLWSQAYRYAIDEQLKNLPKEKKEVLFTLYDALGIVGDTLKESSVAAMGSVKEVWQTLEGHLMRVGERPQAIHYFESHVTEGVQRYIEEIRWLDPNVPVILQTLKSEGKPMALITTDSRLNTMIMLSQYSIMDHFEYIGCGDDKTPCKPNKDQGIAFLEKCRLHGKKMAMVGDSDYDERFATALGLDYFKVYKTHKHGHLPPNLLK